MRSIDTVVIGAGHAGLAVSRSLTDRGIEHVVLERGRLGERWRSACWDSFRLLTPNWLSRLPGWEYDGPDPDGFMNVADLVRYLQSYAATFASPVISHTAVLEVRAVGDGYAVRTDRGGWVAGNVVIATGYHAKPRIPRAATSLRADVVQLTPASYRGPAQPPDGAVLVVGASASGVQIADELARSGRRVILAVGGHTRLPRTYRGRDILWWLDRTGSLDRTVGDLSGMDSAQWETSLQLAGAGRSVDLGTLQDLGVRLAGRLLEVDDGRARFADDLADTTAAADARMRGLLARLDRDARPLRVVASAESIPPVVTASGPADLHLRRSGIGTVVWATGFRPWYPWLAVPVLDRDGLIQHRRGVTGSAGLYAIGLKFQYRRRSTFIDGAREDAAYLVDHMTARRPRRPVGS